MPTGHLIAVPLPSPQAGVEFTSLVAAVRQAGELQIQAWMRKASGELVDRATGDYIAGLRQAESLRYPFDGDQLAIGVFNVARHAAVIEYGHAAFNLAARIRWGSTPKARLSKRGRWYIVIPFRHYTPPRAGGGASPARFRRSMPVSIYRIAKHLGPGERLTFQGGRIAQQTEQLTRKVFGKSRTFAVRGIGPGRSAHHPLGAHPGGRILHATAASARRAAHAHTREVNIGGGRSITQHPGAAKSARSIAAGLDHAREHGGPMPSPFRATNSIYEGMIRSGASGHSQYMTFRVITPTSHWMIPARRPAHVAKAVATETTPIIRTNLEKAFAADVERSMAQVLRG